jgi:drug/metabolite transporter (DMT)-like permease
MSLKARWAGLSPNVRGAAFVVVGAFILIVMASLVKHLGQRLPAFEVLFIRFLSGLIVIFPLVWRIGFGVLKTSKIHLHAARGFVGFMGNICFFFALVNMAIGDTVTIQFSRPILMVGIALLVLRESVGWRRALVALVGFSGVIMITRPFGDGFEPWAIVALGGTFFGTLVVLTIKLLSRTEQTVTIMFYFAAFTTLFAFIPALFVWVPPTPEEWLLLALTGTLGIIGQSMFTHGVGLGDTSFVMPFDYLRIVYAFAIGVLFFGELPGIWSFIGASVIIGSSIYLVRSERRRQAA